MKKRPLVDINKMFSYEKDRDFQKFFYIACEGHKTEKKYFNELKTNILNIHPLEIVTRKGEDKGNSSPKHVLATIINKRNNLTYRPIDSFWAVIDNEWGDLSSWVKKFKDYNIELIVSSPCFELWILLHHIKTLNDIIGWENEVCKTVIDLLKKYDGKYNKNRPLINLTKMKFRKAIELSEQLYENYKLEGIGPWTTMHKLMKELIKDRKI